MNKEILRLAIPNIISNISVPLLSTVDTALMGRLSEVHIGAVGVGSMIFNFIYWNFGFLRMGTTGLTAQAFGRGKDAEISTSLGRALLIGWGIAALILLLQWPLQELSIGLMNVEAQQAELVDRYFSIRIWAAPASLGLYAFLGWFFGMQNAIYPLILTVLINLVNISFSYLFVQVYGMDVEGVAWGTVLAQYFGLVLAAMLFLYRYRYLLSSLRWKALLELQALQRFLQVNLDIFIRTFCLTFAFGFFYSQSASEGELILAGNVILLQYLNWMSFGIDGFAFASESLVGKYAGARDKLRTSRAIRLTFIWGMAMAVGISLLYWIFGDQLLRIFTDQEDVITATVPFLFWMILFPVLATPCYLWDGIFIGLTASKAMRNGMLVAIAAYLVIYYSVGQYLGNNGLWLSLLLFVVARGLIQHLLFWRSSLALR